MTPIIDFAVEETSRTPPPAMALGSAIFSLKPCFMSPGGFGGTPRLMSCTT